MLNILILLEYINIISMDIKKNTFCTAQLVNDNSQGLTILNSWKFPKMYLFCNP